MTPSTGGLRLHHPIGPSAGVVSRGLRGSDRLPSAGRIICTWRRHRLTVAATAEKSPKDLLLDEDRGSLLSRQRKVVFHFSFSIDVL
ncbi:hypothetical protein MLD38_032257 [Melastoma candidum]|uniref:Uncharacterized protein n=1 Tax=Melastoma candidum TaxID=119954 RepID=A0ACB9M534_9MYRT|nr:hypothetical protein MLD38_032257 [Melastoma candidum]